VVLSGVVGAYAGLTPGAWYFAQTDGSVGTTYTTARLGVALSSTDLLLQPLTGGA
jgi:hypothetical protein